MSILAIIVTVLVLGAVGFVLARRRSAQLAAASTEKLHSRTIYHGVYAAMSATIPALLLMALWLAVSPPVGTGRGTGPPAPPGPTPPAPPPRGRPCRP